ncbi:SDR family oxidoreductase [Variovorax dokdonensis]|uniref:SDR family oxidoreductase n=1 Tax=Variovorax dokdonensis TaxID=344883 RepID=A0ABT7N7I7_9BURK|nr:SDR family oxidoreductase [Variovorax dokdonensis]MDM0043906.1 SDR family oxidoreductase [Variovorax dokdonensis]
MQDKVVWITGGATGIGIGAARALGDAGAIIILSGRRQSALDEAAQELRAAGIQCETEALDAADPQAVAKVGADIVSRHRAVDILIYSAGLNVPDRFLSQIGAEDWRRMVDVNLNGAMYCAKAVLPAMREQRSGLIINISSWGGKYVVRQAGSAYTAAKHAVVAFTESLNIEECVNGIRACVICPAEVSTPFLDSRPLKPTEEQRQTFLQPEDLGRVIRCVAELPARACVNEILISPTLNPLYVAQHQKPAFA